MPAVLRPNQQSVCASGRFGDYGKPDVSGSGGDLSRGAGTVPERADEHSRGAGEAAGAGYGGAGGDAGGQSRKVDTADAGFPKSERNVDAAGVATKVIGISRAASGSGGGGSHLRAAACTGGTHSLAEAARPVEPGDPYRQLCESGISGFAGGVDCCPGCGD